MKFPPPISKYSQNISLYNSYFKSLFLISALFFFVGLSSCRKDDTFADKRFQNRSLTIADAKNFFQANFSKEELTSAFNARQFNAGQRKMGETTMEAPIPEWDVAVLRNLSIGTNAVMVPLHIENAYVHISSEKMIRYGFLNYLMMYKDSTEKIVIEWVELKPAEKWIFSKTARKYSGNILVKDKKGKLKKIYSYEEGERVAFDPGLHNRKQVHPNNMARTSGNGGLDCFITTTVNQFFLPKMCACDLHTYEQIDQCVCGVKPTPGYTKTILIQVEVDCFEIPEEEPIEPGTGGGSPGGGSNNSGDTGGGGSPGSGDYPPLNCNPDPDYQVPTVPPPPGTEYVLPCSETEIPVEDIPALPPVPWIDQTPAEMLIEWFNTDEDLQVHLNISEMNYLTENAAIANELLEYLMSEAREVKDFGRWAVWYLVANPTVSFETFKNQFMLRVAEGSDGGDEFNLSEYDNVLVPTYPNLPGRNTFYAAFPKEGTVGMSSNLVYELVGGSMLVQHNIPKESYQNACAIRVSRALNYSDHPVPVFKNKNGEQKSEKGDDGKNYILDAASLLAYMLKAYPDNPPLHLENKSAKEYLDELNGKWGIYIMIPRSTTEFRASGHADFFSQTGCLTKSCYFTAAKEIYFWELF